MFNHISGNRFGSILCLLLTLVISLWIGKNNDFNNLIEEFTVEDLDKLASAPASASASAPASAKKMKKTKKTEGFQQKIYPTSINQNITIETFPKKQPPFPEKYSSTNVFGHVFGLSNPNEKFTIPKV